MDRRSYRIPGRHSPLPSPQRGFSIRSLILLACLILAACGYHFSGGGRLPGGINTISIQVFENRTLETGLERYVSNDLVNEFTRFEGVKVTAPESAGAVLTGVIRSASSRTVSHKTPYNPTVRRIRVVMDVALSAGGKKVWNVRGISEEEDYDVSADKLQTEENKKSALKILSNRIAERIYYELTADF